MLEHEDITEEVIGSAIEVHRTLGPGLLESVYEECLCRELSLRKISFQRQVELPIVYKGLSLDCGYRIDLIVHNTVVVEIKAVQQTERVHEAQLLTYLRLSEKRVGLLINFHSSVLKDGILRRII